MEGDVDNWEEYRACLTGGILIRNRKNLNPFNLLRKFAGFEQLGSHFQRQTPLDRLDILG
jgi:hypothetical protein